MKAMNVIKKLSLALAALASALALAACGARGNEPNVELIQDMMAQPAKKPQAYDDFFADKTSARVPPEHAVPMGFKPYAYAKDLEGAIRENKNPLASKMTDEVLLVGQNFYNTNCMTCHGEAGKGDGPVKAKYPLPIPSLVTDKVKAWQDGQIYHVITMGQGVMLPYASHIPAEYRWQVVNYIRKLQADAK